MNVHQCPFCALRYQWKTELVGHLESEHPTFHHDYPSAGSRLVPDGQRGHSDLAPHGL